MSTEEAVAAAVAVARDHGVPVNDPRIVRDLTNVLVHFAPAPVIARVPLTLARLRSRAWFARELELASFLADQGAPVAPPAEEVEPGPHERDGFLVSFWRHVSHDPARFDPEAAGRSLRDLHLALSRYDGDLPSFDRLDEVADLLGSLPPSGLASEEDLGNLSRVCELLGEAPIPTGRPLHGDSHFGNVLWAAEGPLWGDLENVCNGPVEYDLACLAWRCAPGTTEALAAYGGHDAELLTRLEPFLALFLAAWTIVVVTRTPTESGRAELRRRIDRACAYAREL